MPSISSFSPLNILSKIGTGLKIGVVTVVKSIVSAAQWAKELMSRCYYYFSPKSLEKREIKKEKYDKEMELLLDTAKDLYTEIELMPERKETLEQAREQLLTLINSDNLADDFREALGENGEINKVTQTLKALVGSIPQTSLLAEWCNFILETPKIFILPLLALTPEVQKSGSTFLDEYLEELTDEEKTEGLARLCEWLEIVIMVMDNPENEDEAEMEEMLNQEAEKNKAMEEQAKATTKPALDLEKLLQKGDLEDKKEQ